MKNLDSKIDQENQLTNRVKSAETAEESDSTSDTQDGQQTSSSSKPAGGKVKPFEDGNTLA
ncbi:hypothetical protein C8N46_105249 [Kordia periserrulae]|uniref:Uncharacterized protein n=1 Tax=Kordia periserrulae TaxID=701523 RepID=A0A2T6BYE7_9FLAO|nr:hypothetical protein [Kordia periserrulae]PTX61093.1 hypothetical protein C8N46_105249 [Kordia periserrulae]